MFKIEEDQDTLSFIPTLVLKNCINIKTYYTLYIRINRPLFLRSDSSLGSDQAKIIMDDFICTFKFITTTGNI